MLYSYDKTTDQLVPAGDLGGGGLVGLKSTRTTTGTWTITGLTVGKPLFILADANPTGATFSVTINIVSGGIGGCGEASNNRLGWYLATNNIIASTNVTVTIPTGNSVVVEVNHFAYCKLTAFQ